MTVILCHTRRDNDSSIPLGIGFRVIRSNWNAAYIMNQCFVVPRTRPCFLMLLNRHFCTTSTAKYTGRYLSRPMTDYFRTFGIGSPVPNGTVWISNHFLVVPISKDRNPYLAGHMHAKQDREGRNISMIYIRDAP